MVKHLIDWRIILLGCATLGLAPFFPEPHIWGKIRWIAGGAVGMKAIDWFDTLLHGFPWLMLLFNIGFVLGKKFRSSSDKSL